MSMVSRGSWPERLQVATTWPASEPKLAEWCDGVGCVVYWSPEDHSGARSGEKLGNTGASAPPSSSMILPVM
jgi:hypothetical protein